MDSGPNETALRDHAHRLQLDFYTASYQLPQDPAPLLSVMEERAGEQLAAVFDAHCGPHIIVGSSVGCGVALGALSRVLPMIENKPYLGFLGIKPIIDPLQAIKYQLKALNGAYDQLRNGTSRSVPMPVEGAPGDSFLLTPAHINDADATRLLSDPDAAKMFRRAAVNNLMAATFVFAKDDHLTQHVPDITFCDKPRISYQDGNHNTDMTAILQHELHRMAQNFNLG
ncbi:MAG: hypothetical protein V4621_06980 [Pseudomonadota bacterium]